MCGETCSLLPCCVLRSGGQPLHAARSSSVLLVEGTSLILNPRVHHVSGGGTRGNPQYHGGETCECRLTATEKPGASSCDAVVPQNLLSEFCRGRIGATVSQRWLTCQWKPRNHRRPGDVPTSVAPPPRDDTPLERNRMTFPQLVSSTATESCDSQDSSVEAISALI